MHIVVKKNNIGLFIKVFYAPGSTGKAFNICIAKVGKMLLVYYKAVSIIIYKKHGCGFRSLHLDSLKVSKKQAEFLQLNTEQSYVSSILKRYTLNNNSLTKLLFTENNNNKPGKGFPQRKIFIGGQVFERDRKQNYQKKSPT